MGEGVIKFTCRWIEEAVDLPPEALGSLRAWRRRLRDLGLVGAGDDGVGFGNLSVRVPRGFAITGSSTGGLVELEPRHFALVEEARPEANWLSCRGLSRASSESLSHAAVYGELPWVGGVIHVHSAALWAASIGRLPTTPEGAAYGTPEIAAAIGRLVREATGPGAVVMGGHRDGIIAWGETLADAGKVVLELAAAGGAGRP